MNPTPFPQANIIFRPPPSLDESQCLTIEAYAGTVYRGSLDGEQIVVTAWKPTPEELAALNAGQPVFLSVIGGLPPHFLSTDFHTATSPA